MALLAPSPMYPALQHLPEDQIRWWVALYHAQDEAREAPWYPAWDHTARKLDHIHRRELSMTVPLMCSQQPITFEVDNLKNTDPTDLSASSLDGQCVSSDDCLPSDNSPATDEVPEKSRPFRYHPYTPEHGHSALTTPQRPIRARHTGQTFKNSTPTTPSRPRRPPYPDYQSAYHITTAQPHPISSPLPPSSEPSQSLIDPGPFPPSPLLQQDLLRQTPTSSFASTLRFGGDYTTVHLTEAEKRILAYANKLRSTRIPDLLRRIFKLWGDGEISIFDLIIEIKKAKFLLTHTLDALRRQVLTQAEHIFAADPMIQSIGCILAIGDQWRYEEAYRPVINGAVTAMDTDPDYVQQTSDPHTSSTEYHGSDSQSHRATADPGVSLPNNYLPQESVLSQRFMADTSFMIGICDADSDGLLAAVYERLKALNPSYWSDEGVGQALPGTIKIHREINMDTDKYSDEYDGPEDNVAIIENEDSDAEYESEEAA